MWSRKLLGEIFKQNFILKINIDNKSCKFIAEDENSNARCKHMKIKYKHFNEKKEGKVSLKYVDTENMITDSLTKNISGPKMKIFTDFIFYYKKKFLLIKNY